MENVLNAHLHVGVEVIRLDNLQDAIELLEERKNYFQGIIFEYKGSSQTLFKALVELGGKAFFVLCSPDPNAAGQFQLEGGTLEFANLEDEVSLHSAIKKISIQFDKSTVSKAELEYVVIKSETLLSISPAPFDIYVRLGDGRFVRLFRKKDVL